MSLKLPAISLPVFRGRELICLQNVRDISGTCDILEPLQYPSLTMPELCLQEYGFVTVLFFNIYRLFVNPVTARDILVSLQYQSFAKAITDSDF